MTNNEKCIFCEIVSKNEPASVVYEDDQIMAFLTLRQVRPGELLIIPKEHIDEFCDLSDEISGKIITLANKLSKNIKLHLKPKRVGLAVHGFGVPHAHLIVVPLHEPNDIVSSRHAYLENGEIKFSEKHLPITSRNELNRLAKLISN